MRNTNLFVGFCAFIALLPSAVFGQAATSSVGVTPPITTVVSTVDTSKLELKYSSKKTQTTATGNPGSWSTSIYYDIRNKKYDAIAINKLHDLTVNGKITGWELDAFAGTTLDKDGKAVAGVGFGRTWQLFDQFYFGTGIGITLSSGAPIGGGFYLGAGYKF